MTLAHRNYMLHTRMLLVKMISDLKRSQFPFQENMHCTRSPAQNTHEILHSSAVTCILWNNRIPTTPDATIVLIPNATEREINFQLILMFFWNQDSSN